MLARRAAKLFAHIKDALQRAKLGSPLGADYSAVLRSHLLTVPAYCASVPASIFQGGGCALPGMLQRQLCTAAM